MDRWNFLGPELECRIKAISYCISKILWFLNDAIHVLLYDYKNTSNSFGFGRTRFNGIALLTRKFVYKWRLGCMLNGRTFCWVFTISKTQPTKHYKNIKQYIFYFIIKLGFWIRMEIVILFKKCMYFLFIASKIVILKVLALAVGNIQAWVA